jgi:hypothetical protein
LKTGSPCPSKKPGRSGTKPHKPENSKPIIQTTVRKFYPPDTTAAIFWLKNRKPEEWRDKTEVDATVKGSIEHTHRVSDATSRLLEDLSGIGADRQPAAPVPD